MICKKMHLYLAVVLLIISVCPEVGAQEAPGGRTTFEVQMTPEVAPYNSKIESFYRVMELLVDKPGGLEVSDYNTLKHLSEHCDAMEANLRKEVKEHDYLDVLVGSVAAMQDDLSKATKAVEKQQLPEASRLLKNAYAIATVLYQKPVVQLVVAEQKTDAAIKLIEQKRYQDAEVVLNGVINSLSGIKVPSGASYATNLEKLKSDVLALRRQASEKGAHGKGLQKFVQAIEHSFDTTHESVFGGVWSGPVDMSTLR